MLKIICILGTRPELIKMSRVLAEFEKYTDLIIVHTGQNYDYELNQVFFDDLGIRQPDHFLNANAENASQTIANVVSSTDRILEKEKPDAVLLYGDTNSCLSVIAAKKRKVPIFHMEAGNRCFDQLVPEEINRKVVDHLSDINLVLTEHARRYLILEGIKPETIIKTGSHMKEVLTFYDKNINNSNILQKLSLEQKKYFLISTHREENVDSTENLKELLKTFNSLAEKYGLPLIVSTHPRTKERLLKLGTIEINPLVRFLKPFGFFDFVKLQKEALCVISDSGTITEESYLLDIPAITIRNMHERPEGMDNGTLIMSGLKSEMVLKSIEIIINEHKTDFSRHEIDDYEELHVSKKILRVVFSYVDYVNRNVWRK